MKKVLVVEDNELNLKLFRDLLEAHDFSTFETSKGNEAIEITKNKSPDLIIMDIQLPGCSGIDIIKEIKATKEIKKIPIIAVTAFAMQEDEEKILAAGCEDYLAKPISIDSFIEKIQKYT